MGTVGYAQITTITDQGYYYLRVCGGRGSGGGVGGGKQGWGGRDDGSGEGGPSPPPPPPPPIIPPISPSHLGSLPNLSSPNHVSGVYPPTPLEAWYLRQCIYPAQRRRANRGTHRGYIAADAKSIAATPLQLSIIAAATVATLGD